ncbi:MAG: recombinase family protein [Proteobacteria bacterium]|nr:recombinase family protein [Pseudomonadota bacterium]
MKKKQVEWLPRPAQGQSEFPHLEVTEIIEFTVIPKHKDEFFLREKYLSEGLSTRQISDLIFSARSTVVDALKGFGIPLRDADQTPWYRRGQVGYGTKVVKGRVAVNQRELDTIKHMADLRDKGFSYWKIAEILNAMGVPTKSRRAQWQAATVMKILKAAPQAELLITEGADRP